MCVPELLQEWTLVPLAGDFQNPIRMIPGHFPESGQQQIKSFVIRQTAQAHDAAMAVGRRVAGVCFLRLECRIGDYVYGSAADEGAGPVSDSLGLNDEAPASAIEELPQS